MGMYCCCGVKKRDAWKCECDWKGWFGCFKTEEMPESVQIKNPDKDGIYEVRAFEDGDNHETESEFSLITKNWGEYTNQAISHWKYEYDDNWMGFRGIYAWKENKKMG
jgi:hypothetical protein